MHESGGLIFSGWLAGIGAALLAIAYGLAKLHIFLCKGFDPNGVDQQRRIAIGKKLSGLSVQEVTCRTIKYPLLAVLGLGASGLLLMHQSRAPEWASILWIRELPMAELVCIPLAVILMVTAYALHQNYHE